MLWHSNPEYRRAVEEKTIQCFDTRQSQGHFESDLLSPPEIQRFSSSPSSTKGKSVQLRDRYMLVTYHGLERGSGTILQVALMLFCILIDTLDRRTYEGYERYGGASSAYIGISYRGESASAADFMTVLDRHRHHRPKSGLWLIVTPRKK